MKDHTLRKYLIFAFALAWPLQGLASWIALNESFPALVRQYGFTIVMAVSMFAPLAALLLAKVPLRSLGWKLNMSGNVGWYLAAWLAPPVLCALGAALYFLLFPARFDGTGAAYFASLPAEAVQQLETQGIPTVLLLVISVISALTYAPFLNVIPCLGEEAGWRGFLTPRLTARFGRVKGLLLSGVIWGVWHWLVIVLAGYEYGLEYWGAPVLGPLLFCVFTTALGILISFLYGKTGSIWICALAHGSINAFANIPSLFLAPDAGYQQTVGPFANGILSGLPLILPALFVLLKKPAAPRQGEQNPETA